MTPYGEWHYRELEVFVNDIGMSNLESIVCATKNASKAMKMEGEVGTLENGMLADILILNENPLNDITVLGDKSKISSIILNGNEVDRTKPEPEITPPQGWRLSPYSDKILTQKVAKNR
jgi:imidazolonepropionase-like amidohydrolase